MKENNKITDLSLNTTSPSFLVLQGWIRNPYKKKILKH
jgi:hypothetical protein